MDRYDWEELNYVSENRRLKKIKGTISVAHTADAEEI